MPVNPRLFAISPVRRTRALASALALAVVSGSAAGAQKRSPFPPPSDTSARIAAVPAAVWDSLYAAHSYFALRTAVGSRGGAADSVTEYFRGLVAFAFNDPGTAITELRPLVEANPPRLTSSRFPLAIDALGRSLRAVSRYRESGEAYRRGLRIAGARLDSATREEFRAWADIGDALASTLPARVEWTARAAGDTLPSSSAPYLVRAKMNGNDFAALSFTGWVEVTVVDSSTAASHGIEIVTGSGHPEIGVARTLVIGPATVHNVVVVVVPDSSSFLPAGNAGSRGVLGVDVLRLLGSVAFTTNGRVALSSPSRDSSRDSAATAMAFDGPLPVIAAVSDSGSRELLRVARSLLSARARPDGPGVRRESEIPGSIDAVTMDFTQMKMALRKTRSLEDLPTITYAPNAAAPADAPEPIPLPREVSFVILLLALFVLPRALQRFRIPSAITSLLMGLAATWFSFFHDDTTLHLLATFGIVALFLFAGLEIDGRELRRNTRALVLHGAFWSALVVVTAVGASLLFGLTPRAAALVSLALVTPSTGFILSSVAGFGLRRDEQVAVKTYAIASELLALGALFFILQSTSVQQLFVSLAAMLGIIVVIPLAFRFFAALVAPHAPRSEFAFLLMVAVVCAYATRRLGVYYLVGAFLVGVAAQRFRGSHPAISSERMMDALEAFGSVFIPFYFFRAGTEIVRDQLTLGALWIGLGFIAVFVPVRIGAIALHRRVAHKEGFNAARRIGSALLPTLVFTLVLVDILHGSFGLSDTISGALVLYTVLNTSVPAFTLRAKPPEFENVLGLEGTTGN